MKKFLLTVVPVLVILSMLIAACGGQQTGAEQGAQATTVPTEAAPAAAPEATVAPTIDAGGTTPEATAPTGGETGGQAMTLPAECTTVDLQYWNPFTGPDGPFMGQMVDEFNAANPNVRVTMTSQAEYYTQLTTAAAADTLPDVAIVHADQVATQAFRGVLRPLGDLVGTMGIDGSDYPEAVWSAGEVAGERYAIPLDIHPMTMFVNMDLLREAGINEVPDTAEEFEAAAQAMTGDDNKGFLLTGGFPIQQIFQQMLHQFGGSEFNAEGTEVTWNSEAGVRALQWMRDAQAAYSEPNLEVDAELAAFKSGAAGMIWNGIWQTTNVTGDAVEFEGVATAVPQIGPNPGVWAGSHQLTLPMKRNPDPCKDAGAAMLIKYLVDNSVTWSRAGQIPASNSVRQSSDFQAVDPQVNIAPSVENAIFPPSVPGITDAFGPLGEAVGAIMNGTETNIQAALDNAAQRATQILEENRSTYGDAPRPAQ
jgi:multiple sugar transport system substrate-binding protein